MRIIFASIATTCFIVYFLKIKGLRPPLTRRDTLCHFNTGCTIQALRALLCRSHFISDDHLVRLQNLCAARQLDSKQVLKETDTSTLMEGLYIKIEEEGVVKERYKYVRGSFLQTVFDAESHWLERPLIPNSLRAGVELF